MPCVQGESPHGAAQYFVITDRAQGVASLDSGELEFLLHFRYAAVCLLCIRMRTAMCSGLGLCDRMTGMRCGRKAVADRAQGVASLDSGELDLLLHFR